MLYFFYLHFSLLGQRYAFLSVATIIVNLVRQYRFVTTGSIDDVKTTFDIMLRVQDAKMFMTRVWVINNGNFYANNVNEY